jgi:hypothetical protein
MMVMVMVMQNSVYQSAKGPNDVQNVSISVPIRAHLRLNPLMYLASFLVQTLFGSGLISSLYSSRRTHETKQS